MDLHAERDLDLHESQRKVSSSPITSVSEIFTQNPTTQYASGTAFHWDGLATQYLSARLGFGGIIAEHHSSITPDTGPLAARLKRVPRKRLGRRTHRDCTVVKSEESPDGISAPMVERVRGVATHQRRYATARPYAPDAEASQRQCSTATTSVAEFAICCAARPQARIEFVRMGRRWVCGRSTPVFERARFHRFRRFPAKRHRLPSPRAPTTGSFDGYIPEANSAESLGDRAQPSFTGLTRASHHSDDHRGDGRLAEKAWLSIRTRRPPWARGRRGLMLRDDFGC